MADQVPITLFDGGFVEIGGYQYEVLGVRSGHDMTTTPNTVFLGVVMHAGAVYAVLGRKPRAPALVLPGQAHLHFNLQPQQNQNDAAHFDNWIVPEFEGDNLQENGWGQWPDEENDLHPNVIANGHPNGIANSWSRRST